MNRPDALAVLVVAAALVVGAASGPPAPNPSPSPSAAAPPPALSLAGVAIGSSVLTVVPLFGPPDVVRNTDVGHEWQWVEAGGLDREILTDDDMAVRQILVAEPTSIPGQKPQPETEPPEFPALGMTAVDATAAVEKAGGEAIAEPDPTVRAWSLPGGVVVAELEGGKVGQLLALDDLSARRLGYLQPPPPMTPPLVRRAPVMTKEYVTPYPDAAARAGIEGTVVVRVVVGVDGRPERADVVVSSHNAEIDAASVQSANKSEYRPAQCDGSPCRGVFFDLESYSLVAE